MREALKLALKALEEAAESIDSWGSYASEYFQVKHGLENDISKVKLAITAIKEALAQPDHIVDTNKMVANRILALEALLERQTASIVELQTHIDTAFKFVVGLMEQQEPDYIPDARKMVG